MTEIRPRLFVPFETSGRVRRAFARRGWFAVSCDLKPTQIPCGPSEYHHIGDARDLIDPEWLFGVGWDMMIGFPVCTYTCGSGLHWNHRRPDRAALTDTGVAMFRQFHDADIPRIALENPIGCISTRVREPDQIIQPNQFGEDASKATCLWLKGLPPLELGEPVPGRLVEIKRDVTLDPMPLFGGVAETLTITRTAERWANQTDSGQNRLSPSPDRADIRSLTYQGIADAFADQWGDPARWPVGLL